VTEEGSLTDLRSVDRADVYKAGQLAAGLSRDGDEVVFHYDPDYLRAGGPPVASTLPLSTSSVISGAGAVPPFFAGLLPEGVRLQAVVTGTKTSPDDHLTLLMALGADMIGDVQVVPSGTAVTEPAPALVDADLAQVDLTEVFVRATSADPEQLERVALPGVQAKVSAGMISTPVNSTSGPVILKLNPAAQSRLLANENFFLDMAAAVGLPTPRHQLVTDRTGQQGLIIERFDRVRHKSGGLLRLEQEDGCQVLGIYPAAKYRVKTEDLARALADWVADGNGSRPQALLRILQLVAFSYLVGNGDLHGKNFSARRRPDGNREITPVYDVLSTQPYLNWRDPMALNLYGRADRLTRDHLLDAGFRLGLPRRAVAGELDLLCTIAPQWITRLPEIGFESRTTELLSQLMTHRLRELRGESG
jgi:serine/threonine-protein kinase HipA